MYKESVEWIGKIKITRKSDVLSWRRRFEEKTGLHAAQ
jgi:hypothetical protein